MQNGGDYSDAIDVDSDKHSCYRHSHGRSNDHRHDHHPASNAKLTRDGSDLFSVHGKPNGYHHEQGRHNGSSKEYHRCGNRTVGSSASCQGKCNHYRIASNWQQTNVSSTTKNQRHYQALAQAQAPPVLRIKVEVNLAPSHSYLLSRSAWNPLN